MIDYIEYMIQQSEIILRKNMPRKGFKEITDEEEKKKILDKIKENDKVDKKRVKKILKQAYNILKSINS